MSIEQTPQPNNNQEQTESGDVNPSVWRERLDDAIGQWAQSDNLDADELAVIAFEHGILDRIAPKNEEVREKREAEDRMLYEGKDRDKELYERIAYALQKEKNILKHNRTGTPT